MWAGVVNPGPLVGTLETRSVFLKRAIFTKREQTSKQKAEKGAKWSGITNNGIGDLPEVLWDRM